MSNETKNLEELAQPVGYFTKQRDGNYWPLSHSTAKMNMVPLYSQEYVNALLAELDGAQQRSERLDAMLTESVQALKAAERELESLIAAEGRS